MLNLEQQNIRDKFIQLYKTKFKGVSRKIFTLRQISKLKKKDIREVFVKEIFKFKICIFVHKYTP